MKTKLRCIEKFLAISLFLLPVAAVLAAPSQPIAEVENQGTVLVFYPHVEFQTLILTVTGDCGFDYRQVVKRGEEPFFKLDATTIDGAYTYNLIREEEVDRGVIDALLEARANDDAETPKALCRAGKLPPPPTAQSESFLVVRGEIIYDDIVERAKAFAAPKDIVHNDDVIVDGSLCVGFDCVNGESFGFDTVRLKENNLRIKFDDTSTAASFPRNDWQITANDSANGGASKFSIDDITGGRTIVTFEAGARSHSLYVDDGGRIGSRTSTPSVEIHTIDGDTPTMRLQQDGSSGFAPQTWDVAGNETSFFIRDVTNGSRLPFRIRPNAPSSSIDISASGEVAIGNASPDAPLDVLASAATLGAGNVVAKFANPAGAVALQLDSGDDGNGAWSISSLANDASFRINNAGGAGTELEINGTTGDMTIVGTLTTGGMTCGSGCDKVFEKDFNLPSIEQHANVMWGNGYLPSVGPTPETGPVNITSKVGGILNEVEHAHIYIEQLHNRVATLETKLSTLQAKLNTHD